MWSSGGGLKGGLKALVLEDDAVSTAAARLPANFIEAVSYYLSDRKADLVSGIEDLAAYEATQRTYRIDALDWIIRVISKKNIPKGKKIPKASKEEGLDQYLLNLAKILTPDGWEKKYARHYRALADACIENVLKRENVEQNQAIIKEVRRFLRFLGNVERDGRAASINLQRGHLRRITNG